ncbi:MULTISPECIES: hypothetical protein [Campylobacter]|uniref:hypothetical protein n=1 Tax=Campylobacter TaxID=194 RepID=UPI000A3546C2|nr:MULTISPECIES: hypothetical protein [unclassified Campylobacter]MCR8678981.1 hypothetical protein [Campylobacter sp. RM19072]MCR8696100.1 hypothetical protein [Campylobacter sp. RM19073]
MRVIILLSLFYMLLNSFELSSEQIDRDSTKLSLSPVNLNDDMIKNLNTQKFKILTSHYTLNNKDNNGLNNIDFIDIESLKFNHWTTKDISFNITQTLNKNDKDYNLYGIYSASHNLNLNIFTFTNSINTIYDIKSETTCTHSSNISAQIFKNTKIGTLLYQDDSSKYNANYYINTQIYKNIHIDLSLYNTQSSDNFYTKFKINY